MMSIGKDFGNIIDFNSSNILRLKIPIINIIVNNNINNNNNNNN